jgi:hypothetical protein
MIGDPHLKIKTLALFLLALPLLLTSTGCRAVRSERPVGLQPVDLTAEQAEWAGTWLTSDGESMMIEVTNAAQGEIRVSHWEDKDGARRLRQVPGSVRATGKTRLINLVDPDADAGTPKHLWARVSRHNRELLAWPADAERVAERVKAGDLPGTAKGESDVHLGPLTDAQQELLAGEKGTSLFRWDQPVVLFRAK